MGSHERAADWAKEFDGWKWAIVYRTIDGCGNCPHRVKHLKEKVLLAGGYEGDPIARILEEVEEKRYKVMENVVPSDLARAAAGFAYKRCRKCDKLIVCTGLLLEEAGQGTATRGKLFRTVEDMKELMDSPMFPHLVQMLLDEFKLNDSIIKRAFLQHFKECINPLVSKD